MQRRCGGGFLLPQAPRDREPFSLVLSRSPMCVCARAHTRIHTHTTQPAGSVRQKGFHLTGHSELVPDHTLNSSFVNIINLPWACITSQGPRKTNVLLFGCLSRFWLKIRLVDARAGLWWLLGVAAVSSQRRDVAQGTWLLLLLGHGVALGHPCLELIRTEPGGCSLEGQRGLVGCPWGSPPPQLQLLQPEDLELSKQRSQGPPPSGSISARPECILHPDAGRALCKEVQSCSSSAQSCPGVTCLTQGKSQGPVGSGPCLSPRYPPHSLPAPAL